MKKSKDFCILSSGYLVIFLVLYYLIFIAKGYYHSDCTDTIMWAQAAYDAGSLVNPDFAYAGIMPFGGQLIMLPLVALFGVGMKAQIIGMTIFFLLFVMALFLMLKAMKLSDKWISVTIAVVLLLLSSSDKLREIFWGHIIYYSLGVLFLMVGMALVFKCINAEDESINEKSYKEVCILLIKKQKWLYLLLFIWTIFCCANGMQVLSLYGLPVLGAVIAERFFDLGTNITDKRNLNRYFIAMVLILGMAAGLILGKLVTGDIESTYASGYSIFSDSSKWVDNFLAFFPKFFTLLGVKIEDNMLIYSVAGIFNLLRIICAIILIIIPVIMAFMYKKFEGTSYRIMILVHHFITILILLGWVFGKLSNANWRLSPMIATSAILCVMFIQWILKYADYKRMAAIIVIPVICMSLTVTKDIFIMEKQTPTNAGLNVLAKYLEENDFEYGYATFWYANIITLISNSNVKVRVINLEEGYNKRYYQTNKNWYEKADGYDKYFVILSQSEYQDEYLKSDSYEKPQETIACGSYIVMVYDHNIFY